MTNIEFSATKEGWTTKRFQIGGNIFLMISLKTKGVVTIKKANDLEDTAQEVFRTPVEGPDFEFRLYGETKGKYIIVETSVEPKGIKYADI